MTSPSNLGGLSVITTIGGTLLGMQGQAREAGAKIAQYNYQSGIALINKQIAEQNADYAKQVGEIQAQKEGMKTRAEVGATKATQAGRGLDVNTGSAAGVRDSQEAIGAYDQAIIRSNAARRAYGFQVEATKEENQSRVLTQAADNVRKGASLDQISSILGGASSVASKWTQGRSIGIFGNQSGGSGYTQMNPSGSWAPEDI